MYVCLAGAVRNGELGIPCRFSVFHIFGKMNSRSTSPASFMDMLHFEVRFVVIFDSTYFKQNQPFTHIAFILFKCIVTYINTVACNMR